MVRSLSIAGEAGARARPIHLLAALAIGDGPIASALGPMKPGFPSGRDGAPSFGGGGGSSYLARQTDRAAREFASGRGDLAGPEHLLVALLDQGDPEVVAALASAGLDTTALRVMALDVLGGPIDLPPIAMPPLTPAGTIDRPPLPLADLDNAAWAQLQARQEHVPFRRLQSAGQFGSLQHLEARAALKVASKFELDDDQRYSLLHHHRVRIDQLVAALKPELVPPLRSVRPGGGRVAVMSYTRRRRSRRRRFRFTAGWRTWFSNRRVALRDRWFWLRTLPDFQARRSSERA
jgi:hypothetical protein